MISNAMTELSRSDKTQPVVPLSVCLTMSRTYIEHDLQNALREELKNQNLPISVTTIITQVRVDASDPAFENPTKSIGSFFTKEQAEEVAKKYGYLMKEDTASPKPVEIVEIDTIRA